jgi:hypothetical protein
MGQCWLRPLHRQHSLPGQCHQLQQASLVGSSLMAGWKPLLAAA